MMNGKVMKAEEKDNLQMLLSNKDIIEVKRKIESTKCSIESSSSQSLLHSAVHSQNTIILAFLLRLKAIDINSVDQWGFTPLHYAACSQQPEMIALLLQYGANPDSKSKSGSTPGDIAAALQHQAIVELLASNKTSNEDVVIEQADTFRDWLTSLGAGDYLPRFTDAGYDLNFIAQEGLSDADLDCVGVPSSKLGLRRKLKLLYHLDKFHIIKEQMREIKSENKGKENESNGEDSGDDSKEDDDDDESTSEDDSDDDESDEDESSNEDTESEEDDDEDD